MAGAGGSEDRRPAWGAVLRFGPAALYAGAIYWLSDQPNPLPFLPRAILSADKLLHLMEYAALGALLALPLGALGLRPLRAFALAVGLASAYGASDEIHQIWVPHRDADVTDWAADTAGAALGAAAALRRARARKGR